MTTNQLHTPLMRARMFIRTSQRDGNQYIERGFTSMAKAIARPLAFELGAAFVLIFCVSNTQSPVLLLLFRCDVNITEEHWSRISKSTRNLTTLEKRTAVS